MQNLINGCLISIIIVSYQTYDKIRDHEIARIHKKLCPFNRTKKQHPHTLKEYNQALWCTVHNHIGSIFSRTLNP